MLKILLDPSIYLVVNTYIIDNLLRRVVSFLTIIFEITKKKTILQ